MNQFRVPASLALGLAIALAACGAEPDTAVEAAEPAAAARASMDRINPMIALLEQGQPVFGLYAPSARQRGAPESAPAKSAAELAAETLGFERSDFVFDGSMERGVEEGLPAFTAFRDALQSAGATARSAPLVVKMSEIHEDPDGAVADIGRQLNAGVSGVMFVTVESAEEAQLGIDAMRFASNGGTRAEDVGAAPTYWGMSEAEYRAKADLWPLNPAGELINWTIVESMEGLANVREIAAVDGIGVLWPGAGTLRFLFSEEGADGERVFDTEGWENAIQTVLAACKEFDVACGYPANADDIEMRMEQGFNVFVMGWGERGFETIDVGRRVAGR